MCEHVEAYIRRGERYHVRFPSIYATSLMECMKCHEWSKLPATWELLPVDHNEWPWWPKGDNGIGKPGQVLLGYTKRRNRV